MNPRPKTGPWQGAVAVGLLAVVLAGCSPARDVSQMPAGAAGPLELDRPDLGRKSEARAFLADRGARVESEDIPVERLRQYIEELYAAGAPRVFFADIRSVDRRRVSSWLVVQLPEDAAHRQAILKVTHALTDAYFGKEHRTGMPRGQWLGLRLDERPTPQP